MLYSYRTLTVPGAGIGVRVNVLSGDSRRVTVIISHSAGGSLRVFDRESGANEGLLFDSSTTAFPIAMPFRDWGTAIQGEIWIAPVAAAVTDIFIVDVFRLSQCPTDKVEDEV